MCKTIKIRSGGVVVYIFLFAFRMQYSLAANLLNNYLPASMQALAYYIDLLQYEPSTSTVEPPFSLDFEIQPADSTSAPVTTTTTRPPNAAGSTTVSWWQPPIWWQDSTTRKPSAAPPTPPHKPGLYAPYAPVEVEHTKRKLEGYELFNEIRDDATFDKLPFSLIRDLQTEVAHDDFTNDVESLDNFLRLYDDNYGRAIFDFESAMDRWSTTSTAGKKRIPPTKPYVDFLLVYDLLKRDAKASNLSKYEGYTEEMLKDLYELSQASAERQLYTLFKRMLDRGDIQRSDVVTRIKSIIDDLANPESLTSKALRFIPAMPFLP